MALAFLGMLLYQAWQEDYGPGARVTEENVASPAATTPGDTPDAPQQADIDSPAPSVPGLSETTTATGTSGLIKVLTDTLNLTIDTRGGTIVDARLMQYPVAVDQPDNKYHLLSQRPSDFFIMRTGLRGSDKDRMPTHEAVFSSAADSYEMKAGEDELVVELDWKSEDGVVVTKRYTFTRGSHAFQLEHLINNTSETAWTGREYRQLQRGEPVDSGSAFMYTYTGGAIFSQEDKYQKYDFEELGAGQLNRDVTDGWLSMIQHYFLGAIIPPRGEQQHYYGKQLNNGRAVIGAYGPAKQVAPVSVPLLKAPCSLVRNCRKSCPRWPRAWT